MERSNFFIGAVPPSVQLVFAALGAIVVATKIISYLRLVLDVFILSGNNLRKYGKKGTWAVITGASDGLGKEFATQLASKGFNVILVSRTQSKLEALAKELEEKYSSIQAKTLAMDFTQNNDNDYERLAQLVTGLDIGILLNNVGQSHSIPVPFTLTDKPEMENIININCLATLKVTNIIAPLLAQRKNGLILIMSSFSGWIPTPYLATYSGSKAFLQTWGSALAEELKPSGVDVQVVLSYLITGPMSKVRRASALIPTPKQFVRATLSKVGLGSTQRIAYTVTPWWSHAVFQWIVENTVGSGAAFAIWYNRKIHADIRRRALRKAEREAKKA